MFYSYHIFGDTYSYYDYPSFDDLLSKTHDQTSACCCSLKNSNTLRSDCMLTEHSINNINTDVVDEFLFLRKKHYPKFVYTKRQWSLTHYVYLTCIQIRAAMDTA